MTDIGKKYKLLLVDDEEAWSNDLKEELERLNFEVVYENDADNTIKQIRKNNPDGVLLDIIFHREPKGKPAFDKIRQQFPNLPVIILTTTMVDTFNKEDYPGHALSYPKHALKPEDVQTYEAFAREIRKAIEGTENLDKYAEEFKNMGLVIGNSEAFRNVCQTILKIAKTDSTVLITGENGTGKELIANAIHKLSDKRENKPFVVMHCGTCPKELIGAELFGICSGAATEVVEREGYFERADTGTIFLDEIGTMKLDQQQMLLRVIENREFPRVGAKTNCQCKNKKFNDHTRIKINVRIVAATNTNISDAIKEGTFREDLYYRLNVVNIHVPPLRERKEDIELLFKNFVNEIKTKLGRPEFLDVYRPDVKELFESYDWPGNVRQLRGCIESAMSNTNSPILVKSDFSLNAEQPEDEFRNTNKIIQEMLEGKHKLDVLWGKIGKKSTERETILKGLVDRWLSEKGIRPTYKELADLLGINENNMRQKFSECNLEILNWPKRR